MRALHLDPDTPPIGRQPEVRRIVPSKPNPWYGSFQDGRRFSAEQERELLKRGRDVLTAPALLVKRQATHDEHYWPVGTLPPVFAFEAPIIGKRGDKVKVIAPSGDAKLVAADGWSHRPYRVPRDAWGNPA